MTEKLYDICILQPAADVDGLAQPQVEACETEDGVQLYAATPIDDEASDEDDSLAPDMDVKCWGTLSLDGWQTLCEMLACHHPARFARVIEKWQTLQQATPARRPLVVPEVVTWLTDQGWTVQSPGGGAC